uniref:Sodium-coupled monocarboxylate transporter 1-like n=1 Tax=Saccoglossus kowalevskii TaxID=10224 RepID=A0ABM0GPN0_SACKO|nr:PREDICTED: sodium-coupled monocarboxylate transporter 1-like [Saccoglossus kowalevskii]
MAASFSVVDYVIFSLVLAISACIGLFHAFTGGRQKTTSEFLMADRKMRFFPVGLSLLASFMSAVALLGTSAEIYTFGTMFWVIGLSYFIMIPISAHLFLPVFYRLRITSVYEYLQLRFSMTARLIGCFAYIAYMIMYMAVVMYAPALALNAVTGLNIWTSVLTIGIVCSFYTSLGGMKAVIWTDVFQISIMFAGLLAVIIQGSIQLGGFSEIWQINKQGGRIEFFNFDPDPTIRHTFWSLTIGGSITWLGNYGCNQLSIQRYLSCPTEKDAKLALYLNLPGLLSIVSLIIMCGLVLFAAYAGCDPVKSGHISRADQLLAYYVIEELSFLPGMAGLFIAALFSGALSTLSSGLNCLAAVTLTDIVKPVIKNLPEEKLAIITRIIACSFGGISILMAFAASHMGPILPLAIGLLGMIGGPLLGLFTLGIFFPWTNNKVSFGVICGYAMSLWIGIGAYFYRPHIITLPTSIENCTVDMVTSNSSDIFHNISTSFNYSVLYDITTNMTSMNSSYVNTNELSSSIELIRPIIANLYSISYLWYSATSSSVTIVTGLIVSFITGYTAPGDVDPRLLCPIYDDLQRCMPDSWRTKICCGGKYSDKEIVENGVPDKETKNELMKKDETAV